MDLLIDADILVCQFAYAYEASLGRDVTNDNDSSVDMADAEWAIKGFHSAVERMIDETETENAILCFTGSDNFRYSVLPTYKSNRRGKPRPVLLDILVEQAWDMWDCRMVDCLEADDVMGIMATKFPGEYIIATIDKDLNQIPGIHHHWNNGQTKRITRREADYWFYFQVLTGDPSDGYRGCPGIGVVRAERILGQFSRRDAEDRIGYGWDTIVRTFESRGLTEEDALIQARLARILRVDDYDFKSQRPVLWSPGWV
ncbi:MAG: exonuclease [Firmicutes bacterium]|nr:exonuclease [Bacillota bacterium]